MNKDCRAFPSETQYEYVYRNGYKMPPYLPVLDWEDKSPVEPNKIEIKSDEIIKDHILNGYETTHKHFFNEKYLKMFNDDEDKDSFGSELIQYLNHLYYEPDKKIDTRVLYTTTRMFGYTSPYILKTELSSYQDSYGRTGGDIIIKNIEKMISLHHSQKILASLKANVE